MDFQAVAAAEAGAVEIVEFSWPVASPEQAPYQCLAYCIMKRPSGFLLCVPEGFLAAEELDQGQQAEEAEGIGPSFAVSAPAVRLNHDGEWISPPEQELVHAVVVDLAAHMSAQVSPADFAVQGLYAFKDEDPRAFPLAAEVLRQAKDWLATTEGLPQDRSGYQTAQSAPEGPAPAGPKERAKAKRPTVQQLAAQQAQMMELITTVVSRLDSLAPKAADHVLEAPAAAPLPAATVPLQAALQRPLASVLPPAQTVPKNLAAILGPPPPVRQQPLAAVTQLDKDEEAAKCIGSGELPAGGPEGSVLTSAVLAQSQALCALVSQLSAGSSDPLLEISSGQASSVRGSVGRAKLQAELGQRTGAFASKIRENMERRMDPTKLLPQGQVSYMRYLERHGSFAGQTLLGMIAWQVAQSLDLLQADSLDGARDVLSLLLLMLEQCAQDNGDSTLGWLLTLQADPPLGLFQQPTSLPGSSLQTFSSLAEQRWITVALAFVKELETISVRRAEAAPKQKPPTKQPALPTVPPKTESPDQQLSRKQQRAAAWAAKKAAEAKK